MPPHALLVTANELPLYGISMAFVDQFDAATLQANLQAVTDEAIGRMKDSIVPPLLEWGDDVRAAAARIAVYELKSILGFAPTGGAVGDENMVLRAKDAREWFDKVGAGDISPPGLIDSSEAGVNLTAADFLSDEPRGF